MLILVVVEYFMATLFLLSALRLKSSELASPTPWPADAICAVLWPVVAPLIFVWWLAIAASSFRDAVRERRARR